METIICTLCVKEKPASEFYKNKGMPSGYANQCKECVKSRSKVREDKLRENPEWVEKEKKRARDKYYRLNYNKKYSPKSYKGIGNDYRKKYPEKYKAAMTAQRIKANGEKHHWSYNEEHHKDIIDIDKLNHNKLHRYMIYDQERMMYRTTKKLGSFDVGELLDTKERHLVYYENIKHLD